MVMNTPGGNTVSTAQLAFTLITSMARNVAAADMSMKEGKFERKKYMGVELKGKTLAVVGCGRIGQTVAKWAQKMGMDVIGFDPAMADSVAEDLGIKLVSLSEVWPAADFITLHTPLTPDTRNLICGETISKMKDGVRIVNCARGGIINEADLLSALESGKVAGAAMDVYQKEPPSSEESLALIAHPNVVCTPHLGASTDEAQINVAKDIAKQMCATFEGKEYVGVLNVDYMEHTTDIRLEPFFALSEILGQLQAQTTKNHGKITAVEVECWGEHGVSLMRPKVQKLLKAVVLKGMLKHLQDEVEPTLISAPFLARELGIQPSMGTMTRFANKDSHPYTNLVSAKVRLEDGQEHVITGSVFGTQPHLVQIDNFLSFPAFTPEGTLLMFKNQDRPGVISSVLQTLTDHNINIGKMALARQEGPLALCLMSVDSPLNESIIEELKASSELQDVQCAAFS
uniref:phosphoglycerate dehydrogenase n=1 Tax=Fibrocapsa japonica TaxID=94617 RepID=A0A7S2V587_9STRA